MSVNRQFTQRRDVDTFNRRALLMGRDRHMGPIRVLNRELRPMRTLIKLLVQRCDFLAAVTALEEYFVPAFKRIEFDFGGTKFDRKRVRLS